MQMSPRPPGCVGSSFGWTETGKPLPQSRRTIVTDSFAASHLPVTETGLSVRRRRRGG